MIINNMPMNVKGKYIVVRDVDGELWFWGAWNEKEKAYQAAIDINGMVVTHP